MSGKVSLLIIGFPVLVIAFFLSLSSSVGVFYGEDYHVIIYLEENPDSLLGMLQNVALLGIVPIVTSLILLVAAYLKGSYAGIASLESILLLITGGFSVVWGYMGCAASYITYYDAISAAHNQQIVDIDGYLLQIYSAYGIAGAVWVALGIFLIAISIHSLSKRTTMTPWPKCGFRSKFLSNQTNHDDSKINCSLLTRTLILPLPVYEDPAYNPIC
jgi:hypothetical protein